MSKRRRRRNTISSRFHLTRHSVKVIWLFSMSAIIVGFVYFSLGICKEYFEYRTTSHIAIQDYPDIGVKVPGVVTCTMFWRPLTTKVGEFMTGDFLNEKDDG